MTANVTYVAQWEAGKTSARRVTLPTIPDPDPAPAALNTGHKIDVRFTVLYVGDEFNIGYNYGSSEKTKFVCQYKTNHSDTAYNNHTIAISDIKAAASRASVNSGYQIVGWSKESNANPTTWSLNKSGTTACNKGSTIYLVAKNPNPTPVKPDKPSDPAVMDLLKGNVVKVHCTNTAASHADATYPLMAGSFTVGDVQGSSGNYTCVVTVQAAQYVTAYGNGHTLAGANESPKTITLKYNETTKTWERPSSLPITFNVACDNAVPPVAPSEAEVAAMDIWVTVICTKNHANHPDVMSPLTEESIVRIGDVQTNPVSGEHTCTVEVNSSDYVTQFDKTHGYAVHRPTGKSGYIDLTYSKEANRWVAPASPYNVITFQVKCVTSPTFNDLKTIFNQNIHVDCTTESMHTEALYDLIENSYVINDYTPYTPATDNPTCTVIIRPRLYVEEYNTSFGAHATDSEGKSIALYYADNGWTAAEGAVPVVFKVKCNTEIVPPPKPTDEELAKLKAPVEVVCTTKPETHAAAHFSLIEGNYNIGDVSGNKTDGYTCDITVTADKYVAWYNLDYGKHTLPGDNTKTLTLKYVEGQWAVDTPVTFPVECGTAPQKPTPPTDEIGGATVAVKCITGHGDLSWKIGSSTFTVGEVTGDDTTGYTCTVTVKAEKYVEFFNSNAKADGKTHTLADAAEKTFTMTYVNGAWTTPTNPAVTFEVKCEEELVPVHLVIYRNGNTTTAYKDIALESQPKGHVIDLSTIDIADYYTGNYEFYGWYDDGLFNIYKSDPANPPAGLKEKTVNGWTNLKCMVYDKYQVVYFQSEEAWRDYQNDHSKTEGRLYSTTALFGSTLPTADAPTPTRTGYTFKFWSREGQNGDVTGQTVNGWTNLYAVWEKNTYTVTYTDGVNGEAFTDQAYTAKYEDATPAFEGTPARAGYKFLGWEPTVAETVTENATYVAQWEKLYTVTYTDGVDGKAFKDDVHSDLEKDTPTPAFSGDTPTRKGFVFDGWNPEVAETVTEDVTYTAQWKPVQPDKKAIEGAIGRGVAVVCDNQNVNHGEKKYKPTQGEYTVSDVTGTASEGYTCTVTVKAAKIIEKYSSDMGKTHELIVGEQAEKTVELKWDGEKWVAKTELPITFHVECPPEKPTYDELKGLGINAKVDCTTTTAHNGKSYTLIEDTYNVSDPERKGTAYTCILTVNAKDYVAKYNAEENVGPHTLDDRDSKAIELTWNGEKWTAAETSVTFNVKCELLTVTYTDGVKGEEVFADIVYKDIPYGTDTPAFGTKDPTRKGYKFVGWEPEVAKTVTGNATYTAKWEKLYTVTYTDGAKGKAFKDQVYSDLEAGTDTPKFDGKPTRKGYTFTGWSPKVTDTVTKDVTYVAQWKSVKNGKDNIPKTGDSEIVMVLGSVLLFSFCGAAAVSVYDRKRKHF